MCLYLPSGYVYCIVKCLLCVLNVNVFTACVHVFYLHVTIIGHFNCTGLRTLWWDSSLDTLTEMNLRYSLMEIGLQSISNNNNKQQTNNNDIFFIDLVLLTLDQVSRWMAATQHSESTLWMEITKEPAVCVCVCVHACVCLCVLVCVCVCVHVCVHVRVMVLSHICIIL